ncbi:MAG: polysaccharide deacetylase family protein, partial [Campylobacteraceae bacterium]|nr:polysaccharide deacetylase family protein [Campylobacteraceae bacterium]
QFDYFKENDYEVIPLSKLVDALREKTPISDKWVVLTIDDNFKSFYENGLEVFKEYNYPFTLFVYVKAAEKKYGDYSGWDDLRQIAKYGEVDFHSYAHPHMTKLSKEDLQKDFEVGLKLFEKELGFKPRYFTYPYGEYDESVKNIAKSYGFEGIVNQNMGAVSSQSDHYNLDRSALGENSNLAQLLRYKHLNVEWISPKRYPKNSILDLLHVKTKSTSKKAGLYITGIGWQELDMKNGEVNQIINKSLINERTRLILSIGNNISTQILIKDK